VMEFDFFSGARHRRSLTAAVRGRKKCGF
jgi:hypothetical protein